MYIDTHCHLNFKAFSDDWRDALDRALKNRVEMIVVSTDLETSQKAIEIAKTTSGVWAAIGFHPIHVVDRDWRSEILRIRELIKQPKVVAVGEIGFDKIIKGQRVQNEEQWQKIKEVQERVFDFLVEAAQEFKKPLILHCREAEEVLQSKILNLKSKIVGVQHCFPGDLQYAQTLIDKDFKIGFTGMITYNPKWDNLIKEIDLSNILIETDSPFLTPVPHRGQRNEPSYVVEVARHIAKLKELDVSEVEKTTYINAQELFKLA